MRSDWAHRRARYRIGIDGIDPLDDLKLVRREVLVRVDLNEHLLLQLGEPLEDGLLPAGKTKIAGQDEFISDAPGTTSHFSDADDQRFA